MAMAASGGDLKERVLRLVDHHCAPTNNTSKWLAAVSLLLALALLSVNQLLTMPFAQQLNSQFPWQEQNIVNSSFAGKTSSAINFNEPTMLTGSSIAQQLLTSKELLGKSSVVKAETNQGNSTLPVSNEAGLTTAIVEPIAISDYQNIVKIEEADKYNQFASLKTKNQFVKANNEVLAKVEGSVQNNSTTVTQLPSTKAELLKEKSSFSSSTNVQQLAKTKPTAQLILSTTPTNKFKAQAAIINSSQGDKQLSLVNDKALSSKKILTANFLISKRLTSSLNKVSYIKPQVLLVRIKTSNLR